MVNIAIKEFIDFIDATGGNKSIAPFPSGILERLETHKGVAEIDELFKYLSVVFTTTACSLPDQIIEKLREKIGSPPFGEGVYIVSYLTVLDAMTEVSLGHNDYTENWGRDEPIRTNQQAGQFLLAVLKHLGYPANLKILFRGGQLRLEIIDGGHRSYISKSGLMSVS